MGNINLRNIDEETVSRLKEKARRRGMTVNSLVVQLIQREVGLKSTPPRRPAYHDLDHLAGTWSVEEAGLFIDALRDFERVDEEMWR